VSTHREQINKSSKCHLEPAQFLHTPHSQILLSAQQHPDLVGEPDTFDLIKLILETEGYETSVAYSGQEVLDKISVERPDLVLLNIMMPQLDG